MRINNFFKLVIAVGVSELAGIVGSVFTLSAIPNWYAGLVKPALNPPSWIFGPVWTTLYALMGIAAWLVWKQWDQGNPSTRLRVKTALAVFCLQLFLNAIWSIIFFGLNSPGWALVDIVLLWIAIVWTIAVFYKISKPAAYLLVLYLLWVSFASYLNYAIWILNQLLGLEGYKYELIEPVEKNFHPNFKTELTPKEMLALGVFGGDPHPLKQTVGVPLQK